ncbi:GNAT family N-acetyltransferase [Neptunicella sp. SCSIO 80796]|uniref:GNAT family N-acetyltransferase n=1 Tax=Neptunicella plasticusilytica TaxID=3117012 RepID=UPI003A4D2B7E
MTNVRIRKASLEDVQKLVEFNQAMALETEGKSLDSTTLTAGVETLIKRPEYGFYLVAEQNNSIAAGLLVTYEWSDWRNSLFWWIQSVYVTPEYRRQGLYSSLYQRVQEMANAEDNVCGFRLYVEKENTKAQQTYQALGMSECEYFMYQSN